MRNLFFFWFLCISTAFGQVSNETEVGLASANGNNRTQSYNIKQSNDYKWANNVINFKLRYLNAEANGVETARIFMTSLRYENKVSSRLGLFVAETLEKDRFANIDRRLSSDIGARYHFTDIETHKFFSELGLRYMDERRIDETESYNTLGRVYTEWERKWRDTFTTKYWAEYLPNFTDETDWMFNTEVSLTAVLTTLFSLKTSFLLRYDHLPAPGVQYKTDTLFSTAIVAKF